MKNSISYKALINQIGQLTKQAEALRKNETASVIQNIQKTMKSYGLSPKDLGATDAPTIDKVTRTRRKPNVKFQDPVTGATWTGRGKTPKWMQASLKDGKTKEMFALNS